MKHIKSIITAMLVVLLALPAFARDFEYEGLTYTVLDEEAYTCQTKEGSYSFADAKYVPGNDVSGEIEIPSDVYDGTSGSRSYSVVKIGSYSFARSGITSIVFPSSVTTVGAGAFIDCFDLAKIQLTESVSTLEPYAFAWCTGLYEINLPSTLKEIPTGAFYKSGYRQMQLPESLVSIGPYAFGYSGISIETLPPHLETIGDYAFCAASGISKMTFPETLVSIGTGAFSDGTEYASYCYLSNAVIPASVQSIGAFAFNNLWNEFDVQYDAVTPVAFSESLFNDEVYSRSTLNAPNAALADLLAVTPWNRFARINAKDGSIAPPEATDKNFEYEGIVYTVLDETAKTCKIRDQWYAVEEDNIPEEMFEGDFVIPSVVSDGTDSYTVVEIGWQSFSFCNKVKTVILPETIKTIGRYAFSSSSIVSIEMPESLLHIGESAFRESSLTSITIPKSITYLGPNVFLECKSLESVILPETLAVIGSSTFGYCESLKTINLPTSLVALGTGAFDACWNLEINEWPESLESIGVRAMSGKFGDLSLPKNLRILGEQAFWGCDMSSLTLPASLEYIGRFAFDRDKLTEITYNASNPITALDDVFYVEGGEDYHYNAYKETRLNMPNATLATVQAIKPWMDFERIMAKDGSIGMELAAGDDFEYEGIWYTVIDAEAKTCKTKEGDWNNGDTYAGNNFTGDLIIPSVVSDGVNEYTVVEIGQRSFWKNTGITSVSIPESVTACEAACFDDCTSLTKAQFVSLEHLCKIMFRSTSSNPLYDAHHLYIGEEELTEIVFPESMTEVKNFTFAGGSYLSSITLHDGVTSIGVDAFRECTGLTAITLPSSLTCIDSDAFQSCTGLTSIELPEGLTEIGDYAFRECSGLTEVTIPASVTSIGRNAFYLCNELFKISYFATAPIAASSNVFDSWNDKVYRETRLYTPNASLADVRTTVPWSLFKKISASDGSIGFGAWSEDADFEYHGVWYTVIDFEAKTCKTTEGSYVTGDGFYGGNRFSGELVIPAVVSNGLNDYSVVEIGKHSFFGNTKLTSVSIPASIERIGVGAFGYCEALTKSQFASLESLCKIDFDSNPLSDTHHLYIGNEEVTEIVFPETLTEVKPLTFVGCSYLTTVILHDGITSIGDGAFSGCSGLSSIKLPDSVNSIGEGAFSGCSSLTCVSLPEGLSAISCGAFSYCSGLTEITLPASLSYISDEAFTYCPAMKVTYNATVPIDAGEFVFMSESEFESGNAFIYNNATLYMPNAKLADIQATVPWNLFRHIVASDGSIGMEEPIAPGEGFEYNGIRYEVIDPAAKTCKVVAPYNIDSDVTVPEMVQYKSIDFTVVELGDNAFWGCAGMLSITLPATVQTVGNGVFASCDRLSSIIWSGNGVMPAALLRDVENPNVLVYVDAEQYAPAGLDHNVVAGGICENLVLTPGYPFHPYSDFTANSSRMTKEFMQQTAYDGCSGWETIVLPFDAVKVTSPEGHTLIPYGVVTDVRKQRPFWLYEADPEGEWIAADRIQAGVPYLISMPNNPRYNPAYNVQGAVTFSNPSPQLITTGVASAEVINWASGREFRSLWIPLSETEAQGALGLNVNRNDLRGDDGQLLAPGSAFCAGVTPQPMEAYVTTNGTSRVFPIKGFQSAVLMLDEADGLSISQEDAVLMLKSGADRTVDIYAADGTLLRRVSLQAGEPVYVDGLPQGVCLVAGSKIMIR